MEGRSIKDLCALSPFLSDLRLHDAQNGCLRCKVRQIFRLRLGNDTDWYRVRNIHSTCTMRREMWVGGWPCDRRIYAARRTYRTDLSLFRFSTSPCSKPDSGPMGPPAPLRDLGPFVSSLEQGDVMSPLHEGPLTPSHLLPSKRKEGLVFAQALIEE